MKAYDLLILLPSIVTALGGGGFVVVMVQTVKGQMNAQVFIDLNQGYDDISKDFPRRHGRQGLAYLLPFHPQTPS